MEGGRLFDTLQLLEEALLLEKEIDAFVCVSCVSVEDGVLEFVARRARLSVWEPVIDGLRVNMVVGDGDGYCVEDAVELALYIRLHVDVTFASSVNVPDLVGTNASEIDGTCEVDGLRLRDGVDEALVGGEWEGVAGRVPLGESLVLCVRVAEVVVDGEGDGVMTTELDFSCEAEKVLLSDVELESVQLEVEESVADALWEKLGDC